MAERELYLGPDFSGEGKKVEVSTDGYTVADQTAGFRVAAEKGKKRGRVDVGAVLKAHRELEVAMEHGEVVVGGTK